MIRIACEIQGSSPLLMNRYTEAAAARTSAGSSSTITVSAKGTPRDQAESKLYLSVNQRPMIPGPNIFSAIMQAGRFHKAGKKQITTGTSSLVPAGIQVEEIECELQNPFNTEVEWEVDSRAVVIPATRGRVMCHRPRFDGWKIGFTLVIDERMFDEAIVRLLVDDAGSKVGLGDFRPDRKGPFGCFMVVHWARLAETKLMYAAG